jgi:hypothetical protein
MWTLWLHRTQAPGDGGERVQAPWLVTPRGGGGRGPVNVAEGIIGRLRPQFITYGANEKLLATRSTGSRTVPLREYVGDFMTLCLRR